MIKEINDMREELIKARVKKKELKAELEQAREMVKAISEGISEAEEDEFEYKLKAGQESQSENRSNGKGSGRFKNDSKSENEKDDTENYEEEVSHDGGLGGDEVSSGTNESGGENVIETRKYLQDVPDRMGGQECEREMLERRERKKNIFVRGIRTVGRGIKEELSNIIKEWIGVPMYSRKIRAIGGRLVVELESMENKREIMKNKKCLKGSGIWIEDDLTEREEEIQTWLEKLVEKKRDRGTDVTLGYQKVKVQGSWYRWDERRKRLEAIEKENFRDGKEN